MTARGGTPRPEGSRGGARAHVPVLLAEVLAALAPQDGQRIIDGTFGAGGYTAALLEAAPDVRVLAIDQDGRIVLPETLRAHAGLSTHVAFVGLGQKFQMWEPARFEARRTAAREKVRDHRRLFGATRRQSELESAPESAPEAGTAPEPGSGGAGAARK